MSVFSIFEIKNGRDMGLTKKVNSEIGKKLQPNK